MYKTFIDDSGNDPSAFSFTLAGWVAETAEWERFSDDWQNTLRTPPEIKFFKHHEAKSQTGQFKDWTPSNAEQKILDLAGVIARHENYGVVTGMRHEVLTKLLETSIPSAKVLRSVLHVNRPYDFCFHTMTSTVIQRQLHLGYADKVDFIFDKGDPAFASCAEIYRQWTEIAPPAMSAIAGTVTEGNDLSLMPLQAADLLAGQIGVNIRLGRPEPPLKLLLRGQRIVCSLLRWPDELLVGFSELVQLLNIIWASKELSAAAGGE
jgi:hypothetical protein